MTDLKLLKPAPWYVGGNGNHWYVLDSPISTDSENRILGPLPKTLAEKIVLWRNAEDVMMRRGWGVYLGPDGWGVYFSGAFCGSQRWDEIPKNIWYGRRDPFTALVETDKWYKENVK